MRFEYQRMTGWWKTGRLFVLRQGVMVAVVLSCALFASRQSHAEQSFNQDERVMLELSALGKKGDTIARTREQVLNILQQKNACTAWFQESDPAPAEVFRSLHFQLEQQGPSLVYGMRVADHGLILKHPWGARSFENAGRSSTIQLNANGPFFNSTSRVMQLDPGGMVARPSGIVRLVISPYTGDTPEAQITILLHELGHIIGRLPEDDDSWDGRSSRNTSEVSRHCMTETHAAAHTSSRVGN
jgi:hypothetical protein